MNQYKFKIQWLLNHDNFIKIMEVLCLSSLDKIVIRDSEYNIIETIQTKYRGTQSCIMEYIKEKYSDCYIEIIRK